MTAIERAYKRISFLRYSLTLDRGRSSETRTFNALVWVLENRLADEYTITAGDRDGGIDFILRIGTKKYKFDVKSSKTTARSEVRRHPMRHRHGDILFIIPKNDDTNETLGLRILDTVANFEEQMHQG